MVRQDGTSVIPGHTGVTRSTTRADAAAPSLSQDCGRIGELLARIGDKWSVMIVMVLAGGPRRFSQIKHEIGGVSQRMLTLTLRGLERDGLVTRTVQPTTPPRVDYELTALGHSLREPVAGLGNWAYAHLDVIDEARRVFDARAGRPAQPARKGTRSIRPLAGAGARRT